jgi:hypothetical protein
MNIRVEPEGGVSGSVLERAAAKFMSSKIFFNWPTKR